MIPNRDHTSIAMGETHGICTRKIRTLKGSNRSTAALFSPFEVVPKYMMPPFQGFYGVSTPRIIGLYPMLTDDTPSGLWWDVVSGSMCP